MWKEIAYLNGAPGTNILVEYSIKVEKIKMLLGKKTAFVKSIHDSIALHDNRFIF